MLLEPHLSGEQRAFVAAAAAEEGQVCRASGGDRLGDRRRNEVAIDGRGESHIVRRAQAEAGLEGVRVAHVRQRQRGEGVDGSVLQGGQAVPFRVSAQAADALVGEVDVPLAHGNQVHVGAVDDGLVEQPLGARAAEQHGGGGAAGGLPENQHVVGVAAKGGDVVAIPLQGADLVEQAVVDRGAERRIEMADVHEAKGAHAVVDGDHH